jgi:hypothetical protein
MHDDKNNQAMASIFTLNNDKIFSDGFTRSQFIALWQNFTNQAFDYPSIPKPALNLKLNHHPQRQKQLNIWNSKDDFSSTTTIQVQNKPTKAKNAKVQKNQYVIKDEIDGNWYLKIPIKNKKIIDQLLKLIYDSEND